MQGTSEAVDSAEDAIAAAQSELQEYLARVAGQLGGKGKISYVALHKDSHVLEVPQVCPPAAWFLLSLQKSLGSQAGIERCGA